MQIYAILDFHILSFYFEFRIGPNEIVVLALSGVFSRADALQFEQSGVQGILVGEMLMRSRNIRQTIEVNTRFIHA
jgi:indole-3-glycerol phosphate synthase